MAEQKEQPTSSLPQPEWKHDFTPGPSEEELKRFQGPEWRSELPDIRMELEEEDLAARGAEYYARKEEFASRDPILERLTLAQDARDVAESLVILRNFEDFDKAEAASEWRLEQYSNACLIGAQRFGKTHAQLMEEGIVGMPKGVEGSGIDQKGNLVEGASVNKHGYAIQVKRESKPIKVNGKDRTVVEERFYFGTEAERKALARAFEAAAEMFVIRERIHVLYKIFDDHKADLDGAVKLFYTRAPHLSNVMHQRIFRMPDIARINYKEPETLNNQDFGKRINTAMRLLYVVGKCETPKKMGELQATPGYQKLRDELRKMLEAREKQDTPLTTEKKEKFDLGLLIGDVTRWKSKEARDPAKGNPDDKKDKRGADVIDKEKEEGSRGKLTEFGNVFAHESIDNEAKIVKLIGEIIGDPDAANIGHRIFKLWGLADELGMEIYSDYLPGAEEIQKWLDNVERNKVSYEKWREQANKWLKHFAVPGEPVSSDFSKLFWTHLWRLKDILKDRPSGPVYTVDKVERLCLSLPSLITVNTPHGVRSILEVWWGAEGEKPAEKEEPKDLRDIDWDAITEPNKIIAEALEEEHAGGGDKKKEDKKENKPVRYGAWGLYTLFLYLAGEDNPVKRPWAFLNYEEYNFQDFLKNMFFTSKNKFLGITLNNLWRAGGKWRKAYQDFGRFKPASQRQEAEEEAEEDDDFVKDRLKKEAEAEVVKIKKHYWKGVTSLPQYELLWRAQQLNLVGGVRKYLLNEVEKLAKRFGFA